MVVLLCTQSALVALCCPGKPNNDALSSAGWMEMDGVEFNAPLDTVWVISEAVFTANHLTDTDKQNSTGKYR